VYVDLKGVKLDPSTPGYQSLLRDFVEKQVSKVGKTDATIEVCDQMKYDSLDTVSRYAFKIAAPDWGDLPVHIKVPETAATMTEVRLNYSDIGDRHRCYRHEKPVITNSHEPDETCARKRKIHRGGRGRNERNNRENAWRQVQGPRAKPRAPTAPKPPSGPERTKRQRAEQYGDATATATTFRLQDAYRMFQDAVAMDVQDAYPYGRGDRPAA